MIGVSPAWFVSRYGTHFTMEECRADLPVLRSLSLDAVQLELFYEEKFEEWDGETLKKIADELHTQELVVSQCVAHFMNSAFSTKSMLAGEWGIRTYGMLLEKTARFFDTDLVTVPIGPFTGSLPDAISAERLWQLAKEKLIRLAKMTSESGFTMALEILPGSLVGNIHGFLRMVSCEELSGVGLCLDTKHSHFVREESSFGILSAGNRIVSTHLCDNDTSENRSDAPGKGTINWNKVFSALFETGYNGSYDLEIIATAESTEEVYAQARDFVKQKLMEVR